MLGPTKKRILLTRVLGLILVSILLTTSHSWSDDGIFALLIECTGTLLLGIAALGRAWCALFISGHKTHDLIKVGPYSVVRNPLYLFSFIGAVGVGLCSENILVLAILIAMFVLYYPNVIKNEEQRLLKVHGNEFQIYTETVPSFIPKISLYKCPSHYLVDTKRMLQALCDCSVFLLIYPAIEIIEHLHQINFLPILFTIPKSFISTALNAIKIII